MPDHLKTVVCMRWGDLYPPEYVNVLFNAVKSNITPPFRFICFTNDPTGISSDIEIRPIPDMGLPERAWNSGAWPKIGVLSKEAFDFTGRALFIDLDTFITGCLDEFFKGPDTFRAIGRVSWTKTRKQKSKFYSWGKAKIKSIKHAIKKEQHDASMEKKLTGIKPNTMGTGIFAFTIGAYENVFEKLKMDVDLALKNYINEQHFIENHLDEWTPWPAKSICSVKYHLRRPIWQSFFRHPMAPPDNISVVAFHGDPRPLDMATKWHSCMREFPHMWFGHVKWVRDYWNKYKT